MVWDTEPKRPALGNLQGPPIPVGHVLKPHEKELLDRLGGAIIAAEDDGNVAYVTDAAAEVLQRDANEMPGKPLVGFMPERMVPLHEEGFRRYVESGQSKLWGRIVEVPALAGDGEEVELRLSMRVFRRPDGSNLVVARIIDPDNGSDQAPVDLEKALTRRQYKAV